jgi:hypothetical protein
MCLIITGKSAQIRDTLRNTNGMLADIYRSNPDGIGIMYGTSKGLKVVKVLPKTAAEALDFIGKLPRDDRELALHFRWATHGDKNMLNCHPYDIIPGYIAMMHNGVLHTGNAADKTKSDTWHFIQDYLLSAVHASPELVFDPGFVRMVEDFIDDNRLVFMNGEGRIQHVNKEQGVEHEGMWFSNTYAWSPEMLIPGYKPKYTYAKYASYDDYTWDKEELPGSIKSYKHVSAHDIGFKDDDYDDIEEFAWKNGQVTLDMVADALKDADVDMLTDYMATYPVTVVNTLFEGMVPTPTAYTNSKNLSTKEATVYEWIISKDTGKLHTAARGGLRAIEAICEVMCYYIDWEYKDVQVQQRAAQLRLVA